MGDQRAGYDQGEADGYSYSDEVQNPDEHGDNQPVEEQGYNYAGEEGAVSARDRIEQQRRNMRRNTGVLVGGRDRNEQRTLYYIITVACLLIIAATLFFLLFRNNGNSSNNTAQSGYTQPTPTLSSSGTTGNGSAGQPTLAPEVATAAAISGTTNANTMPNVDATAAPNQPTLPPAAATTAPVQPTAAPVANTAVPPANPADPAKVSTYAVKDSDTFASIAAQYNVNTGQLLAANNATLKNTNDIQAGQSLNIPAPSYSPSSVQWTIESGENLTRIINRLQATDTNIDKIAAANPCQQNIHGVCDGGSTIYPGDTITIPFH